MKRIIAAVMIVFLILPGFAAAAPGGHGAPAGEQIGNDENTTPGGEHRMKENRNVKVTENETVAEEENEAPREDGNKTRVDKTQRDQNRVRLAVHALLAAENRTGGIGRDVSAVAREFNNSVQKTLEAEEQIQARHGFMRFLFGGDEDAARLIAEEAQRNRERVMELRQSIENCTCDDETRTMLREQVRTIEQEQDRLSALADEELQHRGLFRWK
jgi:predicted small secreted protein